MPLDSDPKLMSERRRKAAEAYIAQAEVYEREAEKQSSSSEAASALLSLARVKRQRARNLLNEALALARMGGADPRQLEVPGLNGTESQNPPVMGRGKPPQKKTR